MKSTINNMTINVTMIVRIKLQQQQWNSQFKFILVEGFGSQLQKGHISGFMGGWNWIGFTQFVIGCVFFTCHWNSNGRLRDDKGRCTWVPICERVKWWCYKWIIKGANCKKKKKVEARRWSMHQGGSRFQNWGMSQSVTQPPHEAKWPPCGWERA